MPPGQTSVALDISCGLEQPRTGVGYAAVRQTQALLDVAGSALRLTLFGTRPGSAASSIPELDRPGVRSLYLPRMGAVKMNLWTRWNAPGIERFVGPCDIAHGLFHLLPAARHAKRVVTIHDLSFLRYPQYHTEETVAVHTKLVQHAVAHADAIVAVSESTRSEIIALLNADPARIHVVPNGVDTAEFDQPNDDQRFAALQARLGLGNHYAVHLGTVEPRKNLVRLIEAFAAVRTRLGTNAQLLLIGKRGWLSEPIFARIDALGMKDYVIHGGHLARADIGELVRRAQVCVYPSLYEGFGLPVLEAMSAGTPVITSNTSSLPEVAGDAAWLVDPLDAGAIGEGLVRIFNDDGIRRQLSVAGRSRAQQFSWDASATALWTLYRQLAA